MGMLFSIDKTEKSSKMKGTMKRVKEIYQKIIEVTEEIGANHVGAYAAQSAYFFMLCMIPIILLLLTLVQYTPVTKAM